MKKKIVISMIKGSAKEDASKEKEYATKRRTFSIHKKRLASPAVIGYDVGARKRRKEH